MWIVRLARRHPSQKPVRAERGSLRPVTRLTLDLPAKTAAWTVSAV